MSINIDINEVPLAPKNPLPFRQRLKAARRFDTGPEVQRDVSGPVTRNVLDPNWLMPPLVFITSPLLHRLSAEAKADLKLAGHTIKQAEQPTASCEEQASAARSGPPRLGDPRRFLCAVVSEQAQADGALGRRGGVDRKVGPLGIGRRSHRRRPARPRIHQSLHQHSNTSWTSLAGGMSTSFSATLCRAAAAARCRPPP